MSSSAPGTSRARSVSSMRTINEPPVLRARRKSYSAVRMLPTWGLPVGEGAYRTRTMRGNYTGDVQSEDDSRWRMLIHGARLGACVLSTADIRTRFHYAIFR